MYVVQGCGVGAVQQRLMAEWYDEHTAMLESYEGHEEPGRGVRDQGGDGAGEGLEDCGLRGLRRALGG